MSLFNLFKSDDDNDEYNVCEEYGHNYRDSITQGYTGDIEKFRHSFYRSVGCDLVILIRVKEKKERPCRDCNKVLESTDHVKTIYMCRDKESKDFLYLERDEVDKLYEKSQEE